ncbi:MAG: ABC transporter ATP-binding protein [Balneolales bacterium]|nr:ABC transporter ATP-binding protein [Balneolales bacterium]
MITAHNLSRRFGNKTIFSELSFTVEPGSTLGLLGNNGAGKSTLIHVLSGLISSNEGYAEIEGYRTDNPAQLRLLKSHIGLMPEFSSLNPDLSGYEQVQFSGLLYQCSEAQIRKATEELIPYLFENPDDLQMRCRVYSTGMKKKLSFILALMHQPEVLLLDEPFSGLDPRTSRKVIGLLNQYKASGRTALVSSHHLGYTGQTATHIAVLHEGKFVFEGGISAFTRDGATQLDESLHQLLGDSQSDEQAPSLF